MRGAQCSASPDGLSSPGPRSYARRPSRMGVHWMAGVDILASAFSGANAAFLGEQYARWATDPESVDPTFADLFSALNDDARAVLEEATGASWAPHHIDTLRPAPPSSRQPSTPPGRVG